MAGEARLPTVHQQLLTRDEFFAEIRDRLEQAQQHYKMFYDHRYRELSFEEGQWVWLRLLHRPITSLEVKNTGKLGPKFYGPFWIIEKVGEVVYRLQLPQGAKIHDVFHVGLLKPFYGELPTAPSALPPLRHGRACPTPAKVIRARLAHGRHELLMQWTGQAASDVSWMELDEFWRLYPTFQLEDKLNL
jgi:hypothetical protein